MHIFLVRENIGSMYTSRFLSVHMCTCRYFTNILSDSIHYPCKLGLKLQSEFIQVTKHTPTT